MSPVPLTFDTLAYVKQLEAVGVPREQAEVQANALRRIVWMYELREIESRIVTRLGGMIIAMAVMVIIVTKL